ncbi:MAG TPA: hypothetical protein VGM93_10240 [Acidimicrobiales bacterium]
MSARFEVGEVVDITIRGARVDGMRGGEWLEILYGATGHECSGEVHLGAHGLTVTRTAPAEWPPQPGDIWEDKDGDEWAAALQWGGEDVVLFSTDVSGSIWTDFEKMATEAGPLKLIRRRGWTPTPPAAEPEPADVDERAEMIAGLRAAVDWLGAHPAAPLPYLSNWGTGNHSLPLMVQSQKEWDRAAEVMLPAATEIQADGKRRLELSFGPISLVLVGVGSFNPAPATVAGELECGCPSEPAVEAALAQMVPPVDEDLADETEPDTDEVNCTAAMAEPTDDHAHFCALSADAGPHLGWHICITPDCGRTWSDDEPEAGA